MLTFGCADAQSSGGTNENPDPPPVEDPFTLATWNIRILSDGSRDDAELTIIASILDNYDLIAIQEARDTAVLDRLIEMMPGYSYIASEPTGRGVKEIYGFFYTDEVTVLGSHTVYDPDDLFIREPYVGYFEVDGYDFALVNNHIIYGDSVSDRRAEVALLDQVAQAVETACAPEGDIVILGDFNLPADDSAWNFGVSPIVSSDIPTTLGYSSYDNLWFLSSDFRTSVQDFSVYAFDEDLFNNNDEAASLAVSDHRPVIVEIDFPSDDDSPGDWVTAPTLSGGSSGGNDNSEVQDNGDVQILSVVASPTDQESITIINYSAWPVDLTVWTLGDLNNPTAYNIPSGSIIQPNDSLVFDHSTLGFGINNTSETIYLKRNSITVDTWNN